ncbi:protease modulator HflC [Sphingorhabdus lutea]|uniref:Protein HflC n=1 Tax=Sphingorhabdus lutea TaxID=1913578 RepID=A0A1L3JAG3_9SPHN|nr:protease modulator HflC [Sphingorhabdus lutea]APG62117.1 protease modulator HflC [Sphingorhabdus lutea]
MRQFLKNPVSLSLTALGLIVLASMTISIVPETSQAIITSYGNPKRVANVYKKGEQLGGTNAGINIRIPFVEQIQFIDKRIQSVQMERQEVLSTDQLRLQVDAFARFRIVEPVKMFKTIRTEERLAEQLRPILGSALRNELGKRSFASLLSPERGQVMANIQTALNRQAKKYGAEIIDVRIKRADLPEGTPLESAYKRMESAREQESATIEAEGNKEAQIIRAEAEAQAARIYAVSYGKDPQFYDFYRAMQSYRQTFQAGKGETNVILSSDNDYLEKFRNGR